MDTLDRFLVREFFAYFAIILLLLAALYVGVDFLSKFWTMNMPVDRVFALYGYKLPAATQQFVPVACLLATLLVLSQMSRQNEILALYSSGVGTFRLVSTFVAAVASVSTISFLTFDSLVPAFTKKQILVERGLKPTDDLVASSTNNGLWYRSGNVIYNVGAYTARTNAMEDVNVYRVDNNFRLLEAIHAKRARFRDNDWVLSGGYVVSYTTDGNYPVSTPFKEKTGVIPERPADLKTLQIQEDTMRLKDLRKFINRNSSYGLDTTAQRVSYHERMALVFTPLILVLLGIPFSLRPLKNYSTARSIAFCFLIVFIYLLMLRMTLSPGKGGHLPPIIAGWSTNIIFLVFTLVLIMRKR